ncbi:hypothetical protein GVAV_003353 [Gurleya vavrai]
MDLPVFPIFTLKVTKDCVIAGGGGGDPLYGKRNGIVVYDLTTYKGICFCETDDIIDKIAITELKKNVFNDDLKIEKKNKKKLKKMQKMQLKLSEKGTEIIICACGITNFYIMKLIDDDIKILKKLEFRVDSIFYNGLSNFFK